MSNLSHRRTDFSAPDDHNQLWQYVQSLNPEMVAQLSKPNSPEVLKLIQQAIVTILGNLPHDKYDTMITTRRDELGRLLGSAMIDGYFLRNVEQRLEMEKSFCLAEMKTDGSAPV